MIYEWLWNGVCLLTFLVSTLNASVTLKNQRDISTLTRKLNGADAQS